MENKIWKETHTIINRMVQQRKKYCLALSAITGKCIAALRATQTVLWCWEPKDDSRVELSPKSNY
jgi:hypothetical protein